MSTKAHALLALFLCLATSLVVHTSLGAIGLFFGPSAAARALEQQQQLQTSLAAVERAHGAPWPWEDGASAVGDIVCSNDGVDARSDILRDAGMVAGIFALLLALARKFSAKEMTSERRMALLLLSVPLCVLPGLVGQLVFEQRVPNEVTAIQSLGLGKGMAYFGYCLSKGLFGGVGDASAIATLFHESKVVAVAGLLSVSILGVVPAV
ncbi:hypothetical protein ACHAXT_012530 [Thalassiosira profunda]